MSVCLSDDGVVMIGSRIVLPRMLRRKTLTQAYSRHVGSEKMKIQLRAIFFWSRMTAEIEEFVKQCDASCMFSIFSRKQTNSIDYCSR